MSLKFQKDLDEFYREVKAFQAGAKDVPAKVMDEALAEAVLVAKKAETQKTRSKN